MSGAKLSAWISALAITLASHLSFASVVITGTRVIYQQADREVTVRLVNEGRRPALVQAWLDNGDAGASPDAEKVPFMIVPPLFRLDAGKGQSLRIVYTRDPLPEDRESVFWLNVLEIPPRAEFAASEPTPNILQFSVRSRLKFFYRPSGLRGDADDSASKAEWTLVRKADGKCVLKVTNPTPYHISFVKAAASIGGKVYAAKGVNMVNPDASAVFDLGNVNSVGLKLGEVEYTFMNDYGAGVTGTYRVSADSN